MGARLLTTIGDQGASTREVYSPIEFSLGLDNVAIESYIPAIRKIHAAHRDGGPWRGNEHAARGDSRHPALR
jgi:hypothetical protein